MGVDRTEYLQNKGVWGLERDLNKESSAVIWSYGNCGCTVVRAYYTQRAVCHEKGRIKLCIFMLKDCRIGSYGPHCLIPDDSSVSFGRVLVKQDIADS